MNVFRQVVDRDDLNIVEKANLLVDLGFKPTTMSEADTLRAIVTDTADLLKQAPVHETPAPPSTPVSSQMPFEEGSLTPPLPRAPTLPCCGRCSSLLPGPAPGCALCNARDYSDCPKCGPEKPPFVACHYASRHAKADPHLACEECQAICDMCKVWVCEMCSRGCDGCGHLVCFGCFGTDDPRHTHEWCPECTAKQSKKPKVEAE